MSTVDHTPAEAPAPSRSGRVRSLLALAGVVGVGAAVTLAQFTDSGDVVAEFSTGAVDIAFDGDNDGAPEPYAFSSLVLEGAGPGDSVIAPLEVNNNGTLDFDYTMATTVEPLGDGDQAEADALAAALELTIIAVTGVADCDETAFDDPDELVFGPGALTAGEISAPGRPLGAGAVETLCYQVSVGEDAPQGAGATAMFGFVATQS